MGTFKQSCHTDVVQYFLKKCSNMQVLSSNKCLKIVHKYKYSTWEEPSTIESDLTFYIIKTSLQ